MLILRFKMEDSNSNKLVNIYKKKSIMMGVYSELHVRLITKVIKFFINNNIDSI